MSVGKGFAWMAAMLAGVAGALVGLVTGLWVVTIPSAALVIIAARRFQ